MITPLETAPHQCPGSALVTFETTLKFLAYDLTLSESLTRTALKPHASHTSGLSPSTLLKVKQHIPQMAGKVFPVFPAPGSNGHMNEPTVTKRPILGSRVQRAIHFGRAGCSLKKKEKKKKLAMSTRGSIFLSRAASKGKPWKPTIL